MKPIIKWAGGKTQLLNELVPMMPKKFNTYFEPFFGGGALFFAIKPDKAVINDFNPQLINLYTVVKDSPERLIKLLNNHQINHNETYYYEVRNLFNECLREKRLTIKSASYLLYLNKMGFNGLYRLNSMGQYNVPSSKKTKCVLYEKENITEVSNQFQKTVMLTGDFEVACKDCKKNDFVFFDSPYYNTFDTYQAGGFSEEDHKRLAELFKNLSDRGVYCMLTNSNEDFIKQLYKDYSIKVVNVKRMINSDASNRKGQEVIITNY